MDITTKVQMDKDKLSNVVKGNLGAFLGMSLTPELISLLAQQISMTVNDFFTKCDETAEDVNG